MLCFTGMTHSENVVRFIAGQILKGFQRKENRCFPLGSLSPSDAVFNVYGT